MERPWNGENSGFFNDDGTEIDPELIPMPGLCLTCKKNNNPSEEILCILTRADLQEEDEFICFGYEPND